MAKVETEIEKIEAPKNLMQKMCAIMAACSVLPKDGKNLQQGYKYLKESDVAEYIRPLLAHHGVVVIPSLEKTERTPAGKTQKGAEITRTIAYINYTIINADNPTEQVVTKHEGESLDSGDKGLYKAMTNAQKYFYVRTFCLGSDEDVEKDSHERGNANLRNGGPRHEEEDVPRTQAKTPIFTYDLNAFPPDKLEACLSWLNKIPDVAADVDRPGVYFSRNRLPKLANYEVRNVQN